MVTLLTLLSALIIAAGVLAGSAHDAGDSLLLQKRQATPNSEGIHDDFFYSWWSDGASPVNYTNLASGSYRVEWQTGGNFVGGKGWNPGSTERAVQFSGTHETDGNSYLSIYGWMLDPIIEYYIVESYGTYDPTVAIQHLGTVTCDDSEYDIGEVVRVNPGLLDPLLFQYWSIRRQTRHEGVVNTGCHFDAWRDAGLELGSHHFQIVATEGYHSNGFAEIIVADVS